MADKKKKQTLLRELPSVDEVLKSEGMGPLLTRYPRRYVLESVREYIENLRTAILKGKGPDVSVEAGILLIEKILTLKTAPSLVPVINATGIVLHTNLGRAPLCESALKSVELVARGYSNLEYSLLEGKRGKRYSHLKGILKDITGAEDATVVNNNAGAVLLSLAALARGKEVVVSRGEMVEIGGSFRIPDVMAQSGAVLKEVGATNKTHLRDYENGIGPETALILKVHQSNYRMIGFTAEVPIQELVVLAKKHSLPVMHDLGSGCLVNLKEYGVGAEPVVREIVEAGVDVVTFSGDKLLGGPQAGIILGKKEYIEKINKHPLARALRIDKMTLAALYSTLFEYVDPERAIKEIPTLRMLTERPESIKERAGKIDRGLRKSVPKISIDIISDTSEAGGGSLPGVSLPTYCVSIRGKSPNKIEERLRKGDPPVIARIKEDALLLDARTVQEREVKILIECAKKSLL
jgi:L-seryl-tRNA(Ser) seleniumtransferase